MSLPISRLGAPVLRQTAAAIAPEQIGSDRLQRLIDDMIATMQKANGVGIAAPQIGESLRLMVIASRPTPRYPRAPRMEAIAMLNPRLVAHSTDTVKDWEGCLSVPNQRGLVPRYRAITVEYTNRDGTPTHCELTDFIARIFQHEYDHLEGLVFLDRMEPTDQTISEEEYQKLVSGK